jgi:CTP-dependent riboflavin kinase
MPKEYKGSVFSGLGRATIRVEQNIELYKQICGMDLIPGTLNVRLNEEFCIPEKSIYITPDKIKPTEKKRGVTLTPANLNNEKVMIIVPDRSDYDKTVLEMMAPFNIRTKWGLKDGSIVSIIV